MPFEGEARERGCAEHHVEHLHHAEQAGLGENARQRAGNRRRRFRVGERQPALQRHEAHLHREADEEAGSDSHPNQRRDRAGLGGKHCELERARLSVHQQDAEVHHIGARRTHQEVHEPGAQRFRGLLMDDQEVGGPGHQLPEDVEIAELVRGGEPDQRAGHQEGEEIITVG